jgi:hypothetical protein
MPRPDPVTNADLPLKVNAMDRMPPVCTLLSPETARGFYCSAAENHAALH